MVKLNLIAAILDVLFPIICDLSCDDDEDSEADDDDADNPSSCALQVTQYSCLCCVNVFFLVQFFLQFEP